MKTPQFYFLWVLLCMNVTSGIELLAHAPEMIIGTFAGAITTAAAAGFVGLLGLFNMAGRLLWSISPRTSFAARRLTPYSFSLACCFTPAFPRVGPLSVTLFVVLFVLAVSIYGGCFAMIPAYITDLFGSRDTLTCIHGRLLSAWSVGIRLVSFLLDRMRVDHLSDGISLSEMGVEVLYLPAVLLLVGLISNLLILPVSPEHFTPPMRAGDATERIL